MRIGLNFINFTYIKGRSRFELIRQFLFFYHTVMVMVYLSFYKIQRRGRVFNSSPEIREQQICLPFLKILVISTLTATRYLFTTTLSFHICIFIQELNIYIQYIGICVCFVCVAFYARQHRVACTNVLLFSAYIPRI